jgi:hypothetical protein
LGPSPLAGLDRTQPGSQATGITAMTDLHLAGIRTSDVAPPPAGAADWPPWRSRSVDTEHYQKKKSGVRMRQGLVLPSRSLMWEAED